MSCAGRQATTRWRSTSRTSSRPTTIGLPSSARPLHIGRRAGCSSVRVTYESIRNVISAIGRERTTPALAALAQQLKEADQWRPSSSRSPVPIPPARAAREGGRRRAADSACAGTWRAWCSYGRALRRFLPGNNRPSVGVSSPSGASRANGRTSRPRMRIPTNGDHDTWRASAQRFWRRRRSD
jgi:hypothetical protein